MNTLLLTLALAAPPSWQVAERPPAYQVSAPKPDPYATLYARIAAGEKLVVYSGVRMPYGTVGAVEVVIPGEQPGVFWCFRRPDGKLMVERLVVAARVVAAPPPFVVSGQATTVRNAEPIPARSSGIAANPTFTSTAIRSGGTSNCST